MKIRPQGLRKSTFTHKSSDTQAALFRHAVQNDLGTYGSMVQCNHDPAHDTHSRNVPCINALYQ